MNTEEALKLLTVISQFDGRTVSTDMAAAWAFALDDIDPQDALMMVRTHYRSERRMYPIRPGDLVDMSKQHVETSRWLLAHDVRAAKGYGLISRDHPETWPLPTSVETQLLAIRTRMQEAAGELDAGSPPVDNPVDNFGVRPRALD